MIFRILFIAAAISVVVVTALALYEPTPVVVDKTPKCPDFACLVELRTKQNFERDYNKYMEQARLTALQELNQEAQDMVYKSPYKN